MAIASVTTHVSLSMLLLVVLATLPQCSSSGPTGREWVNAGHGNKLDLYPNGVLYIDKRFLGLVQRNYAGYIGIITKVFKDKHLFNRNPVPLVVYLMADEAELRKYCKHPIQGRGTFVENERAVYVHAGGKQLLDDGTSRALIRDIARAVMYDMYYEDYPAWMEVGVARLFADGAFGSEDTKHARNWDRLNWNFGLPALEQWRSVLADGPRPTFDEVRRASVEELSKMGDTGAAVAIASVYLLKQLEQLETVIWQIRPVVMPRRDAASVLAVLRRLVPRYKVQFSDPVAMLFTLRPDYKTFLECELLGPNAATLERARENATVHNHVGGYWWQYARFLIHLGYGADAIDPLERCRQCKMHRDLPLANAALAKIYYDAEKWPELEAVVLEQLRLSVLPTPTMHMMLAEARRISKPDEARTHVRLGLELPPTGFEPSVVRLQQLERELKN